MVRAPKKRKNPPINKDISSSDEDDVVAPKKKRKSSPHPGKKKKVVDSSSDEDYEEELDEQGNIKNLISYSDSEEEEEEDEIDDAPEEYVVHINDDKMLEGFFGAILGGVDKKTSKTDKIKTKINESTMSQEIKDKLFKKLEKTNQLDPKAEEWFEEILSIPFGKFSPLPIDIQKDNVEEYFTNLMTTLNSVVYGLKNVKEEIINYVAQCLTSKNPSPRILALQGSAGTGKTRIVRDGISKVLKTPMQTFSMGGIKDSSHFVGFDYTYQNSRFGAISQALMDSGVMNPVIFLDELDKISGRSEGEEVENLLIHMTDPIQNHQFKDKYFEGIDIDLSRVIFIFAFNDIEKINPILLDRIHVIKIKDPSDDDKLIIAKNYLIDEILCGFSGEKSLSRSDFNLTDNGLMSIIKNYSNKSKGIRGVKDCIRTILLKINTLKLIGGDSARKIGLSFVQKSTSNNPIVINENNIKLFLDNCNNDYGDDKYLSMYM